jgi:hypothetical protein
MSSPRETGWDIPLYQACDAPWDQYYSALGRFVQMFGIVESRLHVVLKSIFFDLTARESETYEWELLDSVIGSMRIAGLRDNLKRVLRVANLSKSLREEFDYAFNQLGEIHFIRDRIVHHGAHAHSASEFYTSNDQTTHESTQEEILIFTTEMILDMAYDLRSIDDYFNILESNMFLTPDIPEWKRYVTDQRPTWRYKPSSLKRDGPKHWTIPPTRSRQRQRPPH